MGVTNLSSLRNDGQVSVNLDSRHLIFILNTGLDLSSFVRESLDREIRYHEYSKINNKDGIELESINNKQREVNEELNKTVERLATLFNRSAELEDDRAEFLFRCCKEFRDEVKSWRTANVPVNTREEGYEFHHMHLTINGVVDKHVGIFIPKELHRSIHHNSTTMKGIKKINKASLLWLCEQSII